ncbi:LysM peptidoglycan-binding domain-containing protein [Vibrio parahaemolyticus]|nr:LysM peptidoglycan-binding domain-containing protein [Vibrio parahaemolyticus]
MLRKLPEPPKKPRKQTSAGYKPIIEEKPLAAVAPPPPTEEAPAFAYAMDFACERGLFKSAVKPSLVCTLAKTKEEDAISQWREVADGVHTRSIASVKEQEAKRLLVGWNAQTPTPFGWEDITPQDKESLTVEHAFIPLRPAIQIGEVLGLPTQGFLYHFLDGKLLHEYRCQGGSAYHFLPTVSRAGAMNSEPAQTQPLDFILALWKRNGQVVTDQHLLFSREAMDDQAMSAVDAAFLNQHGVKLDMGALVPLTEGGGQRASHKAAQGETLADIAQQQGIALDTLQALNPHYSTSPLESGGTVYTEPVGVYNHGLDVGYPAPSLMLGEGLFSIGHVAREKPFPVVKVASSNLTAFSALAPVRYAIDTRESDTLDDEVVQGQHPIDDTQTFPGGVLRADHTPYTLRQLRDGWLYALSQDPESQAWSVAEYQVLQGELFRFLGDSAEQRYGAVAEKGQSHLLYQTDRPYFLGYASQRWTQRVQDFYIENEQARTSWLRDITGTTHRMAIDHIEAQVADVGDNALAPFHWSCASSAVTEQDEQGLITPLVQRNLNSYQYQVPTLCPHHFVALDDPLGDLTDLYLRLAQSVLPTLQDDEQHRKTVVAEAIRALVRISFPPETFEGVPSTQWIEVEQDIDTCLEYHYYQARLKQADSASGAAKAAIAAEADHVTLAYPAAKARLEGHGIAPALLQSRLKEYNERRKAHRQVDWAGLDQYYQSYIDTHSRCVTQIHRDAPILMAALTTLGTEPLRFGLDMGEHTHHLALSTLMDGVLNDLELSAQQSEALSDELDALITEPDNLLSLASYGFSPEIYVNTHDLLNSMDLSEFVGSTRIPVAGFLSAFNDVVGFSDPDSPLFAATKGLLVPLERQINQAKKAVTTQGDKAVRNMLSLRFRLLNRLMKLPSLSAQRSMAMAVWGQTQLSDGKVLLNEGLSGELQAANARYHQLLMEAKSTNAALSGVAVGSREHGQLSKTLRGLEKQISRHIEAIPVLFREYESKAVGKYSFTEAASKLDSQFDRIGRVDFVVASLNLINVVSQMQTLQALQESAPHPDTRRQEMTLGYSVAWFINNTGAVIKGLSLSKVQNNIDLMESTIKLLKTGSVKGVEMREVLTAERYVAHSLIAGVAGVMAAGLEGWQTMEDFAASRSSSERWLLGGKFAALGMQGLSWGRLVARTLSTRFASLAVGSVLNGWILAANFWGAALYAVVTIAQLVTQRTPLETWLNHSVWGKEPDGNLSAADEYHALLKLLNQPTIQSIPTKRHIAKTDSMTDTMVNFEQGITLLLPNAYEGEVVTLSVGAGFGLSDYQHFTPQELTQGTWLPDDKEPTLRRYHLPLPRAVQVLVAQGQGIVKQERVNVFVGREPNNPYDESDKLASFYQGQTLAGVSEQKAMAESDVPLLIDNHKVQLEVPK